MTTACLLWKHPLLQTSQQYFIVSYTANSSYRINFQYKRYYLRVMMFVTNIVLLMAMRQYDHKGHTTIRSFCFASCIMLVYLTAEHNYLSDLGRSTSSNFKVTSCIYLHVSLCSVPHTQLVSPCSYNKFGITGSHA